MALVDYTSFDDVRAALGVSEEEISDATLSLDLYAFNLESELQEVDALLTSDYGSLPDSASRTEAQTRFAQLVCLFATYAVAKQATISLPMFGPKEQTDGKAGVSRFAQDPYKVTSARILAQYETFRSKLEEAYEAIRPEAAATVTPRPYFSAVSATYDPVTGG